MHDLGSAHTPGPGHWNLALTTDNDERMMRDSDGVMMSGGAGLCCCDQCLRMRDDDHA